MSSDIPYRRNYSRFLIALLLLATCIHPWMAHYRTGSMATVRSMLVMAGAVTMLFPPVLVYAGVRTKNKGDVFFGVAGVLTLLYWIPFVLLR